MSMIVDINKTTTVVLIILFNLDITIGRKNPIGRKETIFPTILTQKALALAGFNTNSIIDLKGIRLK